MVVIVGFCRFRLCYPPFAHKNKPRKDQVLPGLNRLGDLAVIQTRAGPPASEADVGLSPADVLPHAGQGKVRLEPGLLLRVEGGKPLPLKTAQQKSPEDEVSPAIGIDTVGRQAHVLSLAVADEHQPLPER